VNAAVDIYDQHLEESDLVGYYGLGEGWLFEVQRKGANEAGLRQTIAGSVVTESQGKPFVYSTVAMCLTKMQQAEYAAYSKWLIVLTDTVDLELQPPSDRSNFDTMYQQRCRNAVSKVTSTMKTVKDFSLVIVDTHEISQWAPEHVHWPTWQDMAKRLTASNPALNIPASKPEDINEAFHKVAMAMVSGGAAG